MPLTTKVPVSGIKTKKSVLEVVETQLKSDRKNAYTITGLMMTCYGVKESDIRGGFTHWRKGLPTMYTQIRLALIKLVKQKKVSQANYGRGVVYWYGKVK
jgi:hypothetical protein